ncbi:MAG: KH domain-containing protein [bacterium]|nr:KH domain-containing protein [bacterium]
MREFCEYLVKMIVDLPDMVDVSETEDEYGTVVLTITVDPTDMGKVIGKEGKIIKAIRDLVKILAVKEQKRVNVILAEVA